MASGKMVIKKITSKKVNLQLAYKIRLLYLEAKIVRRIFEYGPEENGQKSKKITALNFSLVI